MTDGIETCAAGLLNNTDCDNSPTHTSDTLAHVWVSVHHKLIYIKNQRDATWQYVY